MPVGSAGDAAQVHAVPVELDRLAADGLIVALRRGLRRELARAEEAHIPLAPRRVAPDLEMTRSALTGRAGGSSLVGYLPPTRS